MTPRDEVDSAVRLDLDAIRARADAATGGLWRVTHDPLGTHVETDLDPMGRVVFGGSEDRGPDHVEADAEFIAHARTDIPALLAEVERLRATTVDHDDVRAVLADPDAVTKHNAAIAHEAWVKGFMTAHDMDRGGSPDGEHPVPERLVDELDRWSPYRTIEGIDHE